MKHATKAALFRLWALVFSSGCGYGSDVAYNPSALACDSPNGGRICPSYVRC